MILGALANYYERLAADPESKVAPMGYAYRPVGFVVRLNSDGRIVSLQDIRVTVGNKVKQQIRLTPQPPKRSGQHPESSFLCDNSSFTLGIEFDAAAKMLVCNHRYWQRFRDFHLQALEGYEAPALNAFKLFLLTWEPSIENFEFLQGNEDVARSTLAFRLEGQRALIHETPEADAAWDAFRRKNAGEPKQCLVSGAIAPTARLHARIDGPSTGAKKADSLVSFNEKAFESFGKSQGDNAPISERVAFAYVTALNELLSKRAGYMEKGAPAYTNRVQIADATTVFWAEAAARKSATEAEFIFGAFVSDRSRDAGENAELMALLRQIEEGRPLADMNPRLASEDTKFYVLGLSPNAARIAIRFWQANTFAHFATNMRQHYLDLKIQPLPWKAPPSVWRLLLETAAQRKSENIPPTLAGAVIRAILSGQPYPQTLFGQILTRIRADHNVNGLRAAILKACLTRTYKETIPVSLDVNETNRGYRLGRLFAVLEAAQYAGVGKTNASISDKFISAASATPNRVFPLLMRGSQHHLSSAKKKGRVGRAIRLEKEKAQIIEGLDAQAPFPLTLQLADQGKFFVGYYHQQQELFVPREAGEKAEDILPASEDNGEE